MADKRKQHIVPASYLKAWCDPAAPPGQEYIWITSADGTSTRKKSPRKIFRETDFYTIHLNDGARCLAIEDSFSQIEDRFARLRNDKILHCYDLSADERALLCTFAGMMSARTKSPRRSLTKSFSEIHEMTRSLEDQFRPGVHLSSNATGVWKEYGHHLSIGNSLQFITGALFEMYLCVFVATQQQRFITSDHPCTWFNHERHKWPAFFQPGLAQQDIEITLPISPTQFSFFSWESVPARVGLVSKDAAPRFEYLSIPDGMVTEMNRRTAGCCDEYVVSHTSGIRREWFESDAACQT